jgi:formylglycine-generating enzyme required for sulfatase activity
MLRRYVMIGSALWLVHPPAVAAADAKPSTVHRSSFRDCRGCPEMIVIPSGTYRMGSAENDPTADTLERPPHPVHVRRFAAGKFDVTRSEWAAFAVATKRPTALGCQWTGKAGAAEASASWKDLGFPQTPRDPVVCVTWQDAQEYAAWLSKRSHQHYRLLSESEWEYASRAGDEAAYPWKIGESHDFANHGTEECCGGLIKGRDRWTKTSPGDAFPPNAFGLYDMHGNVLQWVEDCFSPTYSDAPNDGSAYLKSVPIKASGDLKDLDGTMTCSYRVVRGGDWGDQVRWVRSAARSFAPPPGPGPQLDTYRSGGVGFRVARDLD